MILVHPDEWTELQKASSHAMECELPAFVAQKAQESHERRHLQLAVQAKPNHIKRMQVCMDNWSEFSFRIGITTSCLPH